ncbi:hypothetical protein PENANT_c005G07612 [Penicillium antarcticum]|uniref:Armadillo-like helical domain-containing protein n=1 Tax=Penicillium antarcticum TaxID=416450 RepID=A0A1V6QEL7_9EURO|nr:hypothetical protein PENANT_c005G07612 [Penicillium antarcticum]
MEASPLTLQSRPESFKPKIVQLYENLFKTQTQLLFTRAIREAAAGVAPADSYALDTLTIFLTSILGKKYTNPSSDVITVLAGLDEVDHVISDFVAVLDGIIRSGKSFDVRLKAIRTAVAMTSGACKTSLVSYLTHRDLFPSLMKYVSESDTPMRVFDPFLLLGLLANYNKFEFQNPYQLRLDDFVNESSIEKIAKGVGLACGGLRNGYIAVQDDIPEGWNLTNTLIFFGLRAFAPGAREKANPPTAEEAKAIFAELQVFSEYHLLFLTNIIPVLPKKPQFSWQHTTSQTPTSYSATIFHAIAITLRLLTHLSKNKIRLTYHWSELWRTLLSLMRFLTTYASDLTTNPKIQTLTSSLADLIAFCVSGGDTFLPDPSSYDDLFYKLVETGPIISKFRAAYAFTSSSTSRAEPGVEQTVAAIDTLQSVSTHFYTLLFHSEGGDAAAAAAAASPKPDEPASVPLPSIRKKNLSPREVHRIIRQGYDTLSIQPPEGLSTWAKWREAEWKSELKKAARCAVDDARQLVA